MALFPGRKILATASGDATVRIWDPSTGEQQQLLEGHAAFSSLDISSDGKLVAAATSLGPIRGWDVAPGELEQQLGGRRHVNVDMNSGVDDSEEYGSSDDDDSTDDDDDDDDNDDRDNTDDRGGRLVRFSPNGKQMVSVSQLDSVALGNRLSGRRKLR